MQMNYTPSKKASPIHAAGHVVGVVECGVFKKTIQFSKHALRTPPALALSVDSLRQAEQFGAHEIEITDKESGCVYSCKLEHFRRYSWQLRRGGFETQRAMVLERWSVTATEHPTTGGSSTTAQPIYTPSTRTHHEPVQLALGI